MRRMALLGSNGQLGSDIRRAAQGYSNIDLLPLTRTEVDAESNDLMKALEICRGFDVIVNCISYHKTDECEDYPEKTFQVNALFVLKLAQFCSQHDTTLIQISSDYVFDGDRSQPYRENDPVNPLNIYGMSKAAGEFFVRQYVPRHFILRLSSLFGVAGASGKGGNFIETMLRLARADRSIKVIDDQYMSPTYAADVARVILKLVDNDVTDYGIYHCNNSGACSWYELAETIFDLCDLDPDLSRIKYDQYRTKAVRPRYSVMDNNRISRLVKIRGWQEALKDYLRVKGYFKLAVNR